MGGPGCEILRTDVGDNSVVIVSLSLWVVISGPLYISVHDPVGCR